MEYQKYLDKLMEYVAIYGMKALVAILIIIIGLWLVKKAVAVIKKMLSKRNIDETLQKFLGDFIGWILKVLVFITAISQLGVEVTSFIAILGAAGLAVGMALQGSLANFAGGVLIMIFKPFKVGDLIEAQGELGVVKEIQIFVTKIITPENKLSIIPNGILSNGTIVNYTEEGKLRVDMVFGVDYGEDIKKTKDVLLQVLQEDKNILKDPKPTVNVIELADSSVNFAVRPWATPEKYWDVYFGVTEKVKLALDKEGIEIPYPHQVEIKK